MNPCRVSGSAEGINVTQVGVMVKIVVQNGSGEVPLSGVKVMKEVAFSSTVGHDLGIEGVGMKQDIRGVDLGAS